MIQPVVRLRDRRDAIGRLFEMSVSVAIADVAGLQLEHARDDRQAVLDPVVHLLEQKLMARQRGLETALVAFALDRHAQNVGGALQEGEVVLDELVLRPAVDLQHAERLAVALQDDVHGAADAVLRRISGVRNRSSFSRWLEITGLPVRNANPAGEAEIGADRGDADNAASQPTPARTRSRFSAGMCSSTLQNSACRPSAVSLAVSPRSLSNEAPCSAATPSSANISCWRIRCCRARYVRSGASPCGFGSTTGSSFSLEGHMRQRYPLCRAPTSAMAALRQGYRAEQMAGLAPGRGQGLIRPPDQGVGRRRKRSTTALARGGPNS